MFRRSGNRACLTLLAIVLVAVAGCSSRPSSPRADADREPVEAGKPTMTDAEALTRDVPMTPPVEVPERAMSIYTRGLAAMNSSNWLEAQIEFEQLIGEYPAFPGPYVNLSIIYRRDGRVDEAETALEQALAIAPDHAVANSELGIIYRERGDFSEAEAAYRRAIEADPGYALAHYNLGVLLDLYLKREAEALAQYEAYLSLTPVEDVQVERWVIDLRRRLGLPEEPVQVAQETGT